MQAKAAQKEIEEFTLDFKNAARRCFELIDKDGGGTLSITEIVEAVKSDQEVISFLKTCGEENLMFLLHPPRLKKALEALDADGSGEIDVEEWETAINKGLAKRLEQLAIERERRERAALRDDAEFSTEFLNAARRCFEMIDKDESGTLEKEEIVRAVRADQVANAASYNRANFNLRGLRDLRNCCFRVFGVWWCRNNRTTASHFAPFAGRDPLPKDVRRGELAVPAGARAPQEVAGLPRHGRLRRARRRRVARRAASSMVSCRSSDVASTPSTRRRRRVEA